MANISLPDCAPAQNTFSHLYPCLTKSFRLLAHAIMTKPQKYDYAHHQSSVTHDLLWVVAVFYIRDKQSDRGAGGMVG